MNDKKYPSSWDAEVMKRIIELEREREATRAAGYAEAIEKATKVADDERDRLKREGAALEVDGDPAARDAYEEFAEVAERIGRRIRALAPATTKGLT